MSSSYEDSSDDEPVLRKLDKHEETNVYKLAEKLSNIGINVIRNSLGMNRPANYQDKNKNPSQSHIEKNYEDVIDVQDEANMRNIAEDLSEIYINFLANESLKTQIFSKKSSPTSSIFVEGKSVVQSVASLAHLIPSHSKSSKTTPISPLVVATTTMTTKREGEIETTRRREKIVNELVLMKRVLSSKLGQLLSETVLEMMVGSSDNGGGMKFLNEKYCNTMARMVNEKIRTRGENEFYKIVVNVSMSQRREKLSMKNLSRCYWNEEADLWANFVYKNDYVVCVASVFLLFSV
jgi:hypothetical protein